MLPSLNSMVSRLRLKHFRLLVALDDCGSLLKAAEYVALRQPGATKASQEIESALGAELFIRNNGGHVPTHLAHSAIAHTGFIHSHTNHSREEHVRRVWEILTAPCRER